MVKRINYILGSASTSRQAILRDAGYEFSVIKAGIDEKAIRDADPKKLVLKLAHAKAQAILPKIRNPALLITADQVVVCNNEIFEKPESAEQAREFWQAYKNHPAETVTSLLITDTATAKTAASVNISKVYFHHINDELVENLITQGDIFHCAGGFQVKSNNQLASYIKSVDGDVDEVKGLSLQELQRLLKQF